MARQDCQLVMQAKEMIQLGYGLDFCNKHGIKVCNQTYRNKLNEFIRKAKYPTLNNKDVAILQIELLESIISNRRNKI